MFKSTDKSGRGYLVQAAFILMINIGLLFSYRGDLVSTEILATRNVNNTQTYIEQELAQIVTDMFSIDPAQYGYWMYKITYETIDIYGDPHIATGTISYPRVDWPDVPDQAFPIMSYQHGTVVEKSDVTSVIGEWILPAILTGSGYVYVEPDYLGLGDSEGMHPYQLKEPYGTAVVDMLRAVRYYAAFENDPRVQVVIPISPVRLSYSYYMNSADAEEFQNNLELADQMEADGRALDLMKVNFPITQFFSAASYLDKHGPGERYNLVDLGPRIHVPILALAGSLETHTRLVDMASDLVLSAVNSPSASYEIIKGGDHSLQNRKNEASKAVLKWVTNLKS